VNRRDVTVKSGRILLAVLGSIVWVLGLVLPVAASTAPSGDRSANHVAMTSGTTQGDATPMVAAGGMHTVGLKRDGTVVAVGTNSRGQCDVGQWTGIVQVAAGDYHTVGLESDGTVVAVGLNKSGQCNVGDWTNIVQVAAGTHHTVGLRRDGTVVAVGANTRGQCDVDQWKGIVQVAAGCDHTVGLRSDGTVVAVGYGYGELDVGRWTDIVRVAAGCDHTVGLRSDGTVVAVASNTYTYYGQCDVSNWTHIIQMAGGGMHTVGLKSDGTVVATGDNTYGQCDVSAWTNIVQVSAGELNTVGLRSDGTVVAAGAGLEPVGWNLGSSAAPAPSFRSIQQSVLTVSSTGGGIVVNPGKGSFKVVAGLTVPLVARPDTGYHFVRWTGEVDSIVNANAARTSIAMSGNYSIRANFAVSPVLIGGSIAGIIAAILVGLFFRTREADLPKPGEGSRKGGDR
jgi:hypothetical protein